jgi:Asp-tRNA(Asn)/Glu-tRNA(Gln) amidotransferase A subunit family amidase
MIETCLLIKTKNHKRFLTYEKNLPSLIEFAKTFHAEIHLVEPKKGQKVLELKMLTAALCDSEWAVVPKYRKIEKVFPKPKRDRQTILAEAKKIRKYVKKKLLDGKPISLKDLKKRYKEQELTDACLCNHLSAARRELVKVGHKFRKLGAGRYCLSKS